MINYSVYKTCYTMPLPLHGNRKIESILETDALEFSRMAGSYTY